LVVETAEPFEGMSGQIKLNTAGDRIGGDNAFGLLVKIMILKVKKGKKEHSLR
jgi:hypothetical protein